MVREMVSEAVHAVDCSCEGCVRAFDVRSVARDALVQLGTDHPRFDLVRLGEVVPTEWALLSQLKEASSGHSSGNGSVGRPVPGVPFDVVALEMFESVERDLNFAAVVAGVVSVRLARDAVRDARLLLERVDSLDVDWLEVQGAAWAWWVERIRGYLMPVRRTPVPGLACPDVECGQVEHVTYDDEGEAVRSSALSALWSDDGRQLLGIECACCFSFIPRQVMTEFALETDPDVLLHLGGESV